MVDYQKDITAAKLALVRLQERKKIIEETLHHKKMMLQSLNKLLLDTEKARAVVQKVAEEVQKDLEYRITNIVTIALASVFPDPYEFKIKFVSRRNQTEVDLLFVKNGNECDPMDSTGGGAIDIASLALRMAIWSIKKTRAIQILDEPCKFLSRDLQEKASEMLKTLSTDLGIQMIVVSHIPEMITAADRIFQAEHIEGVSHVKTIR